MGKSSLALALAPGRRSTLCTLYAFLPHTWAHTAAHLGRALEQRQRRGWVEEGVPKVVGEAQRVVRFVVGVHEQALCSQTSSREEGA
eukprot:159191-Chlamydomonas_euryale.AAC.1